MAGDAHCLLNQRQFDRTTKETLGKEDQREVRKRMINLYSSFQKGINGFENIKKAGWNDYETFESLFMKYTNRMALDPSQFPVDFKMLRKFESGLIHFNNRVAKKRNWFAKKFHVSKAALRGIPDLDKFEKELSAETSFYRSYTNSTGVKVNEILSTFNDFVKAMDLKPVKSVTGDISTKAKKDISKIEKEYTELFQDIALAQPGSGKHKALQIRLDDNRRVLRQHLETHAGKSLEILNDVLKGTDPETIPGLTNPQKRMMNTIQKRYSGIRKEGVVALVRGLQRIQVMAKEKGLAWGDSTVDKIKSLIKSIEFQETIDNSGKFYDHKFTSNNREFLKFGFELDGLYKGENGRVSFAPHYMSQYSLELLKTISKVEKAVDLGADKIDVKIRKELDEWDSIVNVAKQRSTMVNDVYSIDPYFFLRKYTSDVGLFNYKTHVKSTFSKASKKLLEKHLTTAERYGDQNIVDSAKDMMQLLDDIKQDISHMDPTDNTTFDNISRMMTSFTYFRLMGGNVRSAARNLTQLAYEFVEFGWTGIRQAQKFYSSHANKDTNASKVARQKINYGLQWGTNKVSGKTTWDWITGKYRDVNLTEQSRGALSDATLLDKNLYIDKNGELTIKSVDAYSFENMSSTGARTMSNLAQKFGTMHRLVEDFNRSKTFDHAFALAHENLDGLNKDFVARKMLSKSQKEKIEKIKGKDHVIDYKDLHDIYKEKTAAKIEDWIENTAGQIAYNSVQDLHFEYAKWNKASAVRAKAGGNPALNFVKSGLGQFSHYRFEMTRKMWGWGKEGLKDMSYGDLRAEPFMKMMRYGVLQASIFGLTYATRTNLVKLMPNDVQETLGAFWTWMASNREKLTDGEVSKETLDKLGRKTYGQNGLYFLGPNIDMVLSATELLVHSTGLEQSNPVINQIFNRSTEKAFKGMERTEALEFYQDWQWLNSAGARLAAYTWPVWRKSGLRDAATLELGLFPTKEQREWSNRLYGVKKKSRKKTFKKSHTTKDKIEIIRALEGLRGS